MKPEHLTNTNVKSFTPLISPEALKEKIPLSDQTMDNILKGRQDIRHALRGQDQRLLVIVGPCSFHDPGAGFEYARRLQLLAEELKDRLIIVMRVYFEKPRTTVGWKGLINDPHLDGSQNIELGLETARKCLAKIAEIGLPTATEFLDPIVPQYISDLVSWAAVGARTTESQTHREMASGLSMPVGFKNATDGSLKVAADAMVSAQASHSFLGIDHAGQTCVVRTGGNKDVHLILRGGGGSTNFDSESIQSAVDLLEQQGDKRLVMIDCSHGNSHKDFRKQAHVLESVLDTIKSGQSHILGLMIESFIEEGRQEIQLEGLNYGQSITDACIGWDETEALLRKAHKLLSE